MERLDDLVIGEVLSPDVYKRKRGALLAEKASLGNPSTDRLGQPAPVMKLFEDGLSLLRSAPKSLAELSDDEKAVFARQLAFNLKLTDKTVLVSANFPFSILAQAHHCPSMRAWRDWVETLSLETLKDELALRGE